MNPSETRSCEQFEPFLSAHLLGELSGKEQEKVAAHVEGCGSCQRDLELLSSTAALVAKSAPVESELSPFARTRILAAAGGGNVGPTSRRRGLYWVGGLAAAAVLVVAVVVIQGDWGSQGEQLAMRTERPSMSVWGSGAGGKAVVPEEVGVRLETYQYRSTTKQDVTRTPKLVKGKVPAPTIRSTLPSEVQGGTPFLTLEQGGAQVDNLKKVERAQKKNEVATRLVQGQYFSVLPRASDAAEDPQRIYRRRGAAPASVEGSGAPRSNSFGLSGVYMDEFQRGAIAKNAGQAPSRPKRPNTFNGQSKPDLGADLARRFEVGFAETEAPPRPGQRVARRVELAGVLDCDLAEEDDFEEVRKEKMGRSSGRPTPGWKTQVDDFLTRLDRRPGETPGMMFFRYWGDNPFAEAAADPLSTFGVDVDTASYALARSYLYKQGSLPPTEAIRTEEFINYFKSHYAPPTKEGHTFAIHTRMAPSPFAHEPEYKLLEVGIKGREVARKERKACSLVFVVDTSGSMRQENRLELVKEALRLLVAELDEGDSIGIVAFSTAARKVLDPTPASEKERILDAIATLQPEGSTNAAAGLELGYAMAAASLLKDGSNRVLLLSDGVANTGAVDVQTMLGAVSEERQKGVYLTCAGVGMGNHNDALLEQLADRGNGQCVYVDRLDEARKVFVENLTGTLETIARDVKIQVEFDPAIVLRYRLLGYENRAIADSAFRDNTVDAGEVGAGHEVTALYEVKLKPEAQGKIATVRVRHLTVEHGEAQEIERAISSTDAHGSFADAPPHFRLTACVAEVAEVLRDSYWARGSSLERVSGMLTDLLDAPQTEGGPKLGEDRDVVELVALVKRADALVRQRAAQADEVARTVDALKENYHLRARVQDQLATRRDTNRTRLDDILRQNAALRQQLEELLQR